MEYDFKQAFNFLRRSYYSLPLERLKPKPEFLDIPEFFLQNCKILVSDLNLSRTRKTILLKYANI